MEILLPLRRGQGTLRAQVERQLRTAIRAGRLAPGAAVPSTRALASHLGISRGVIVGAYEQLVAEGYLVARPGSGTRVAGTAPAEAAGPRSATPSGTLRFDFRPGVPALETFPRAAWVASLRRVLEALPHTELGYGDPRGLERAREALAAYLGRVRGVHVTPERVLYCSGFSQGTALICRALRRLGAERLAMEEPCHPGQRTLVTHAGLQPVPVPVDEHGVRVDALATLGVDALIVTPAHQFPTGAVLSPRRRAALVDWAGRHDALVVEDDYDAEYRYDREPIGALQGLAPDRIVYAGSASKTLAPGLRLGWLVLPSRLVTAVVEEKTFDDLSSPVLEQAVFADLLARGEIDRHLRRNRIEYRARRAALVAALAAHLERLELRGIAAGLHAVAELPAGVDEAAVVAAAAARSVGVYGMAGYQSVDNPRTGALVLGYGGLNARAIDMGIRVLASAFAEVG